MSKSYQIVYISDFVFYGSHFVLKGTHTFIQRTYIFVGVVVNCGLIGLLGPVHRIFPNITPVQQVILIIVLEVSCFIAVFIQF